MFNSYMWQVFNEEINVFYGKDLFEGFIAADRLKNMNIFKKISLI